jgi:hypothetical protein
MEGIAVWQQISLENLDKVTLGVSIYSTFRNGKLTKQAS